MNQLDLFSRSNGEAIEAARKQQRKPTMAKTGSAAAPVMAFSKINFDATNIPPDAPAGNWQGKTTVTKRSKEENNKVYPQLQIEMKIVKCLDEDPGDEQKAAVKAGLKVRQWITLVPKGHKGERWHKGNLRDLAQAVKYDLSQIPVILSSWSDLDGLIEAVDGKTFPFVTTVQDRDGEKRVNVSFRKGGGGALPTLSDTEEEETDDEEEIEEEEETDDEETDEEETDDEEEEEEEPEPPPVAKKPKKKKKA